MVCLSCAVGLWLFYTNGLDCHCLFGRHVVAFICHFLSVFFPLPLHLCFLSFSQWSSCGWNPVNVIGLVLSFSLCVTGLALQLNGDSVLSWLQNTSSVLSPSSLDEPAIPAHRQRLSPSAHKRIILRHVFSA
ncbi:uncharacterized protein LOC133678265 [Populus nigra]|uniref:uncharacterized protein LOC133678265 n=1 Tax=Populus nigra TaxID=3691 RepID=UPI002B26C157|nr:uncharacterized protein LOC133678265 [Populus nigra]XP_061956520.1 uncharacterized protein LOC133678265 [Populus nigra]